AKNVADSKMGTRVFLEPFDSSFFPSWRCFAVNSDKTVSMEFLLPYVENFSVPPEQHELFFALLEEHINVICDLRSHRNAHHTPHCSDSSTEGVHVIINPFRVNVEQALRLQRLLYRVCLIDLNQV